MVMPSAPAPSARAAARTTLGMSSARLLRSRATLLMLTESAVLPDDKRDAEREWRFIGVLLDRLARSALQILGLDHHLAGAQNRRAQMIVKLGPQQALQLGKGDFA